MIALFAILSLPAGGSLAAPPQQIVDRVVARIEDDVLTLSEVRELGRFQQLANGPGAAAPADEVDESKLLSRLIEQWIIETEATAARFPRPGAQYVQRDVSRLEKLYASPEAYRARLRELGLTEGDILRLVAKQLYLSRYINAKFRPAVQVDTSQIEYYYREQLVPELKRRGQEAPPLEQVQEQIRELLMQREISARAARWLDDTRARLRIEILMQGNTP